MVLFTVSRNRNKNCVLFDMIGSGMPLCLLPSPPSSPPFPCARSPAKRASGTSLPHRIAPAAAAHARTATARRKKRASAVQCEASRRVSSAPPTRPPPPASTASSRGRRATPRAPPVCCCYHCVTHTQTNTQNITHTQAPLVDACRVCLCVRRVSCVRVLRLTADQLR